MPDYSIIIFLIIGSKKRFVSDITAQSRKWQIMIESSLQTRYQSSGITLHCNASAISHLASSTLNIRLNLLINKASCKIYS